MAETICIMLFWFLLDIQGIMLSLLPASCWGCHVVHTGCMTSQQLGCVLQTTHRCWMSLMHLHAI